MTSERDGGLKVLGAGFGRTGTTSLRAALDILGFGPTYHMEEVMKSPGNSRLWADGLRSESFDWDELFDGYRSAVDWPASAYYKELAKEYPQAKIILTVRDPEKWYESSSRTIFAMSEATRRSIPIRALTPFVPHLRNVRRLTEEIIWVGVFGGDFGNRRHATGIFEENTEEVKRSIPAERLLVYEVGEGWGPLCDFLGVGVPDEPFPHLNDTDSFRRNIAVIRGVSVAATVGVVVVFGLVTLGTLRRKSLI